MAYTQGAWETHEDMISGYEWADSMDYLGEAF